MNASVIEIVSYQHDGTYLVNLTGVSVPVSKDKSLSFGDSIKYWREGIVVEGKQFSMGVGLNIFYQAGGVIEHVVLTIDDQPPLDEAYLHVLHLDLSKPYITAKARYGDKVGGRLPYKMSSDPVLLFAPMDLPIDFYTIDEERFESTEGYVTKKNSHIIFTLIEHAQHPLWGIELKQI